MKKSLWAGFLPNLLGIILGIVLTFGANSLWQRHEERKKTKEMLTLIRHELETNKVWFKYQDSILKRDSYVYSKILAAKGNWATIPKDTLALYMTNTMSWGFTELTTSSWEIFRNSETIQKISDKELVIRLAVCYYWIEKVEAIIKNGYVAYKMKACAFEEDPAKYFSAVMANKESVRFYSTMGLGGGMSWVGLFAQIDAIIDYTLQLMDKNDDYRYNMSQKEKEFEAFIVQRVDSVLQRASALSDTTVAKQN